MELDNITLTKENAEFFIEERYREGRDHNTDSDAINHYISEVREFSKALGGKSITDLLKVVRLIEPIISTLINGNEEE